MNVYLYCNNDPINFIDAWGLCKGGGGGKQDSWWDIDANQFLNDLEILSNSLMMNPGADGMPQIPLDQGLGLFGLGISKGGRTVLGHFPEYILKAKQMGASFFNIGKKWNLLSDAQRWVLNKRFLDAIAKSKDQIYLSVSKTMIRAKSTLAKEIEYLVEEKGYKWINQWSLKQK